MEATDRTIEDGDELFEHFKYVADPGQQLLRVDKFLCDRLPNTSRNRIQLSAKAGFVKVNDASVKPNFRIRPHDVITLELPFPIRDKELVPEDLDLEILYEDDEVLVLNKEAGMVVHPGYGNYTGTMVHGLMHHFNKLPSGTNPQRPGLVHRLDKLTTGVMVVAKSDDSLAHLAKQFYDRSTERRYWALVWGDLSEDGTVTGNLARSLKNRKLMEVYEDPSIGKHAVTHYKVIKRLGYVTLVECKLETGRTHQIRVHMAYKGNSLLGDQQYGKKNIRFKKINEDFEDKLKVLSRQALHAKSLGFIHPTSKKNMSFESKLPKDFKKILDLLNKLSH
ncbi:MAG TPA: RNA pseudouridine synthase [Flavobacteriales bacterium]|nr:RNA pseudouridine synthase [Flavobacteriales bacterium]